MAAPKGNRNAKKAKDWENALRRILTQYEGDNVPRGTALAKIAEVCVLQALSGDKDARTEIANRLDGKAREHIEAEFTQTLRVELSDAQLELIAAGSSNRAADEAQGQEEPSELH